MKNKSERDVILFVEDIIESIERIELIVSQTNESAFLDSWQQQDILARRIEIIGEATKNIPDELRKMFPEIPFKDMAGMREVIVHYYFGLSYEIMWNVATTKLPPLKDPLLQVIAYLETKAI
ncbi:MAG: DUF86 domain-containing protein [Spirosomataceae bacterium]